MGRFPNTQGITKINYQEVFYGYCPLGDENYKGTIEVEFIPNDLIPDYCEETKFIDTTYNQCHLIGEDVVSSYFDHLMTEYNPKALTVVMHGEATKHFPVTITKSTLA